MYFLHTTAFTAIKVILCLLLISLAVNSEYTTGIHKLPYISNTGLFPLSTWYVTPEVCGLEAPSRRGVPTGLSAWLLVNNLRVCVSDGHVVCFANGCFSPSHSAGSAT